MTDGINYPFINKDNASNVIRPSQVGEFIVNILVNEETAAARLNRNAALLEAFAKRLVYKNTTIYSLGDNAC